MTEELSKEFRLEKEAAAEFLRDIADSLEEDEQVNIDGENWKVSQPVNGKIPMRIFSNEEELEIGFKLSE